MAINLGGTDPAALAKQLNQFVTDGGGQAIPGLDQLDPSQLIKIRDGLKQFLDNFDQAKAQDPQLATLADSEGMKSLRALAQVASTRVDQAALGNAQAFGNQGFAANGSNFDPMALNSVGAAAAFAAALRQSSGVFAPSSTLTPGSANAASYDGLDRPSQIGDDNTLGTDAGLESLQAVGGGGGTFEDRVFAIMCKVTEDFQKQIEDRLNKLQQEAQDAQKDGGSGGGGGGKGGGLGGMIGGIAGSVVGGPIGGAIGKAAGGAIGGAVDGGGGGGGDGSTGGSGQSGSESRNIEFEKIKYDMQKLSQMQQAMSNVLDSMDELAKNAIHHIKAG